MGNCCKKRKNSSEETSLGATAAGEAFYDCEGNRFVWDDENKQGFTWADTGQHYTQDKNNIHMFRQDDDRKIAFDISAIVNLYEQENGAAEDNAENEDYEPIVQQEGSLIRSAKSKKSKKAKSAEGYEVLTSQQGGYEVLGKTPEKFYVSITKENGEDSGIVMKQLCAPNSASPDSRWRKRSKALKSAKKRTTKSVGPNRGTLNRSKVSGRSRTKSKVSKRKRSGIPRNRQPD